MFSLVFAAAAWALPSIDAPLKTGARAHEDAAVVIGIESYYELPEVPYAKRDATAFSNFLRYTRGVPSAAITELPKGNRETILQAVDRAAAATGDNGTLWIYFAGHGAASPETGERMILGIDVQQDLATFQARSMLLSELKDRADVGTHQVVMVLDTCYTGTARSGASIMKGKRFAVPTYASPDKAGVIEWSAASANQFSGPLEAAEHGAFTYAVIGALRGWADGQIDDERDGIVTVAEADLYVKEALRSLQINDQVPVLGAKDAEAFELIKSAKLEEAPPLDDAAGGDEPMSKVELLQEVSRQQDRAATSATMAWRTDYVPLVRKGGAIRADALADFLATYETMEVTVGGESYPVEIGEVPLARELAADPDLALSEARSKPVSKLGKFAAGLADAAKKKPQPPAQTSAAAPSTSSKPAPQPKPKAATYGAVRTQRPTTTAQPGKGTLSARAPHPEDVGDSPNPLRSSPLTGSFMARTGFGVSHPRTLGPCKLDRYDMFHCSGSKTTRIYVHHSVSRADFDEYLAVFSTAPGNTSVRTTFTLPDGRTFPAYHTITRYMNKAYDRIHVLDGSTMYRCMNLKSANCAQDLVSLIENAPVR